MGSTVLVNPTGQAQNETPAWFTGAQRDTRTFMKPTVIVEERHGRASQQNTSMCVAGKSRFWFPGQKGSPNFKLVLEGYLEEMREFGGGGGGVGGLRVWT